MSVIPVTLNDLEIMIDACNEILKCKKCRKHAIKILNVTGTEKDR